MINFDETEKLATLIDSNNTKMELSRVTVESGLKRIVLEKDHDSEDGIKKSKIVMSETAAFRLYLALDNYFMEGEKKCDIKTN